MGLFGIAIALICIVGMAVILGKYFEKKSYKNFSNSEDSLKKDYNKDNQEIIQSRAITKDNQRPKKNKIGIIIFTAILIGLYIYLIIPIEVTTSFMGIEIGVKMQYQPLTTCLDYYVTLGNEAHNRVCGVSPVKVFQAKTKMGNLFEYLMQ